MSHWSLHHNPHFVLFENQVGAGGRLGWCSGNRNMCLVLPQSNRDALQQYLPCYSDVDIHLGEIFHNPLYLHKGSTIYFNQICMIQVIVRVYSFSAACITTIIVIIIIVITIIFFKICGLQLLREPHRSTRLLQLTSRWQHDG